MSGMVPAQDASIPVVYGTKNSMSVADALTIKEDIKIIKEMEGKRKRKEFATAIYNTLDIECPMPNNNLWFSAPIIDLEENKKTLPKLMSRKDVMEHFGISKSTLWRWTNVEEKLKSFSVGRRKFFKVEDVDNMIEEHYQN